MTAQQAYPYAKVTTTLKNNRFYLFWVNDLQDGKDEYLWWFPTLIRTFLDDYCRMEGILRHENCGAGHNLLPRDLNNFSVFLIVNDVILTWLWYSMILQWSDIKYKLGWLIFLMFCYIFWQNTWFLGAKIEKIQIFLKLKMWVLRKISIDCQTTRASYLLKKSKIDCFMCHKNSVKLHFGSGGRM